MSTSSVEHSRASLSPSASQTRSHHEVSLDTLVFHLLASKRSLSSISTVWRANEIVTSARAALEESVRLSARTRFLRNGISEQVRILQKVRSGIQGVYNEGEKDFTSVLKTLDTANARLEFTMDMLRSTMVEAAFRPPDEEPRSLLDFVDEQGVETMRDALKESIEDSHIARAAFDSSILSFEDDMRALKSAMTTAPVLSTSQSNASLSVSPIPENLQSLEVHAQEMASLLDSLVSHFDLCVTAIRNTEGGFAAVRKAASDLPPDAEPVSVSGVMSTSQNQDQEDEPPTEEERRQMLAVLENDASQVEDVVVELRERLVEMESRDEVIQDHVENLRTTYNATATAFSILESISSHLPGYLMAVSDFRLHWDETKLQIQEQLQELESMRVFYENYHASYDGLILEVYRRKQCEERVKAVMKKAMEQIDKLVQADMREREAFRADVGEFLPVDLWNGVPEAAPRWGFKRIGDLGDDGSRSSMEVVAPDLERPVIEAAGRRDRERQRLQR